MINDYQVAWNECLEIVKQNINQQSFKTWFEPIKAYKLNSDVLTIQVPNKFFYEWLEEHYVGVLKTAIKQVLGEEGRLEYQFMVENHRKIGKESQTHGYVNPAKSPTPQHPSRPPITHVWSEYGERSVRSARGVWSVTRSK